MADGRNVTGVAAAVGSGAQGDVAVDEAGGFAYQLVKLVDGTLDSTTPIPGDAGGLRVQVVGRQPTNTTGSLTAAAQSVTATATNFNQATFQLSGTYTGVTVVFEGSVDGTIFTPFQVQQEDTGAALTGRALVNSTSYMFTGSLPAVTSVRVRCSALATGTVAVAIGLGGLPLEPVVSVGNSIASTSAPSNVASSASSVSLLAANPLRKGASLFNDSTSSVFVVNNASAASTTNFSVKMAPGTYYEVPSGYTGEIRGIWVTANGSMRVTEYTP